MANDPYAVLNYLSGGIYTGAVPRAHRSSPGDHRRGRDGRESHITTGAAFGAALTKSKPLFGGAALVKAAPAILAAAPPPPPPPPPAPPIPVGVPPSPAAALGMIGASLSAPPPRPAPPALPPPAVRPPLAPFASAALVKAAPAILAAPPPPPPALHPALAAIAALPPAAVTQILSAPTPPPRALAIASIAPSIVAHKIAPAILAAPTPLVRPLASPPVPVGPAPALKAAMASQTRALHNKIRTAPTPAHPAGIPASALLPVSQVAALQAASLAKGGSARPPGAMPHPAAVASAQRAAAASSHSLAHYGGHGNQPQPAKGHHAMGLQYLPTGKRTYCPFVSLAVAAGAVVDIIVRPQLVFRGDEIIVGATVAGAPFNLSQIKIGVVPQAVAGGEVPTECFPPSCGPKFGFDIADQGTDITMTVHNLNAAAKDFYGILVGDEVYPSAA